MDRVARGHSKSAYAQIGGGVPKKVYKNIQGGSSKNILMLM